MKIYKNEMAETKDKLKKIGIIQIIKESRLKRIKKKTSLIDNRVHP